MGTNKPPDEWPDWPRVDQLEVGDVIETAGLQDVTAPVATITEALPMANPDHRYLAGESFDEPGITFRGPQRIGEDLRVRRLARAGQIGIAVDEWAVEVGGEVHTARGQWTETDARRYLRDAGEGAELLHRTVPAYDVVPPGELILNPLGEWGVVDKHNEVLISACTVDEARDAYTNAGFAAGVLHRELPEWQPVADTDHDDVPDVDDVAFEYAVQVIDADGSTRVPRSTITDTPERVVQTAQMYEQGKVNYRFVRRAVPQWEPYEPPAPPQAEDGAA